MSPPDGYRDLPRDERAELVVAEAKRRGVSDWVVAIEWGEATQKEADAAWR